MKEFLRKLRRRLCSHDWQCIGTRNHFFQKSDPPAQVQARTETSWLCFRCGARRDENLNWRID